MQFFVNWTESHEEEIATARAAYDERVAAEHMVATK
jgi:hypothetical protein